MPGVSTGSAGPARMTRVSFWLTVWPGALSRPGWTCPGLHPEVSQGAPRRRTPPLRTMVLRRAGWNRPLALGGGRLHGPLCCGQPGVGSRWPAGDGRAGTRRRCEPLKRSLPESFAGPGEGLSAPSGGQVGQACLQPPGRGIVSDLGTKWL